MICNSFVDSMKEALPNEIAYHNLIEIRKMAASNKYLSEEDIDKLDKIIAAYTKASIMNFVKENVGLSSKIVGNEYSKLAK